MSFAQVIHLCNQRYIIVYTVTVPTFIYLRWYLKQGRKCHTLCQGHCSTWHDTWYIITKAFSSISWISTDGSWDPIKAITNITQNRHSIDCKWHNWFSSIQQIWVELYLNMYYVCKTYIMYNVCDINTLPLSHVFWSLIISLEKLMWWLWMNSFR